MKRLHLKQDKCLNIKVDSFVYMEVKAKHLPPKLWGVECVSQKSDARYQFIRRAFRL